MARPLRLEYPGALYHVTSRGDRKEDIYDAHKDRYLFLSILADTCDIYNWHCHAYCLLDNHYHLLIETPDANLSRGMRHLNGVYTQSFNRAHKRVGHVFQGRYKAIHVEKDSYLLELARYIVLNPVRAEMVRSARHWPWSSYRATAGQAETPEWLTTDWILSMFGQNRRRAVEKYQQFVNDGKNQPAPWKHLKNQVFLGSEEFLAEMLELQDEGDALVEVPRAQRRELPRAIAEYVTAANTRDEAITAAYLSGGYTLAEIGEHFGLHYATVSKIVKKARSKT